MSETDLPDRLIVISPHLDDAALGCAELIAACRDPCVMTLFAGVPESHIELTAWDAGCGFKSPMEAMNSRRREDGEAMSHLGASLQHFDFFDVQYGVPTSPHKMVSVVASACKERDADTVAVPLGLFHSDHALAHQVAMHVKDELSIARWICYEDGLYKRKRGAVQARLAELVAVGTELTPESFEFHGASALKLRALYCYRSQLHQLGLDNIHTEAAIPERYWRIEQARI